MTKKDYIAIAKALAAIRPDKKKYSRRETWETVVTELCSVLDVRSNRFNMEKFVEACYE